MFSRKTFSVLLCVLGGSLASACGRKGPPLAPIVYLPRPATEVIAKRVENEVVVQFKVPVLNTDGTGPADLRRVEVYAHTGPLPTPADFLKYGTLVASVDIANPADEKPAEEPAAGAAGATAAPGAEGATPPDVAGTTRPVSTPARKQEEKKGPKLTAQGEVISVREPLTDKHSEIGPMPPTRAAPPPLPDAPVVEKVETPGTQNFESIPTRYYTVVGVSRSRGRRGPYAGPLVVPLAHPLVPPEKVDVSYTEAAISLAWPGQPEDQPVPLPDAKPVPPAPPTPLPPGAQETPGTREIYADIETEGTLDVAPPAPTATASTGKPAPGAAAAAAAAAKAAANPPPRYGYNVYEVPSSVAPPPDASSASSEPAKPNGPDAPRPPVLPLNATLLTSPVFNDPRVEFDIERCYFVRRVEMASGVAIEGAPSAPICVTPIDKFPPAPPRNVQAIAGGSSVSLLWEANTEPDFGGYLVLRGEAPGDKLAPLTKAPIADTSFNDTTVRRGRTYVYEVIAVDKQTPANQSAPSNRVEETIR